MPEHNPSTPFLCPACKQSLVAKGTSSVACANNHSYDYAKEGYLNLLLAQHKRSKQPGDDATMMACRQQFLNTGSYQFLAQYLAAQLAPLKPSNLLDIGCGEGYYGHFIQQQNSDKNLNLIGIDIAKTGVRLAAKRRAFQALAVASAFDLPLADHSIDAALSVFAPLDTAETQAKRKRSRVKANDFLRSGISRSRIFRKSSTAVPFRNRRG